MKRIATLTFCCLMALSTMAQAPIRAATYDVEHARQKPKKPSVANKSMALNSRLISYRSDNFDNGNWEPGDTLHLVYTGTRGGDYFRPSGSDFDTETGYSWDGSTWENSWLTEKTYDANDRMLSFTQQFWDGTVWEGNDRDFYTYDASGRVATYVAEHWDFGNGNWVPAIKHIYTYDTNGNVLVDEEQEWSTISSTWRPYMKSIKTYNTSNQPLTELQQEHAGGYFDRFRNTWVYSSAGNLDTTTNEEYNTLSSVWEPRQRSYYTHNAANQVLTQTNERYVGGAWAGIIRYTYTYNGQGHRITELVEEYVAGAFENDTKSEMTVDGNGRTTEIISSQWDGSAWRPFAKQLYGYDAAGNEALNNYFDWASGAWQERFRELSTYNAYNQLVSDTIMRDFFNGIVEPDFREYYYYEEYEDGTSGIGQIPALVSTVMPNPFTINVAIQVVAENSGEHTFEVYNMAGQLVHTETRNWATGQQTIVFDGQELPKGVYYYKINSARGVASGKLMKQ